MIPQRTASGAFVRADKQRCKIEASYGGVDDVVAHLDLNEDSPGDLFPYFTRGGLDDNAMSAAEFEKMLVVMGELFVIAQAAWPRHFKSFKKPIIV